MKKILLSLMTLGVVAAVGVMATRAYFSDIETSNSNTFSSGTVDISVNGQNPWSQTGFFTISDMKPSTVFTKEVTLKNEGVNPVDLWKKVTVAGYTGGLHPESEDSEDPGNTDNNIGQVIRYDMTLNGQPFILEAAGYVMDSNGAYPAHTLSGQPISINGQYIYLGRLDSNATLVVNQSYHMDGSTTNWAQGDTMNFEVEFYALQTTGGAPAPTPELLGHGKTNLDYLDIGLTTSPDMVTHDAKGWMNDPGIGGYGGRDGGSTIAMVWGEGGVCNDLNKDATFVMNAGSKMANHLILRHLEGITNDSFDVYVNGAFVAHYTDATGPSETWETADFSVGFIGQATVRIVPTAPAWGSCATYGQIALNWAEITE